MVSFADGMGKAKAEGAPHSTCHDRSTAAHVGDLHGSCGDRRLGCRRRRSRADSPSGAGMWNRVFDPVMRSEARMQSATAPKS